LSVRSAGEYKYPMEASGVGGENEKNYDEKQNQITGEEVQKERFLGSPVRGGDRGRNFFAQRKKEKGLDYTGVTEVSSCLSYVSGWAEKTQHVVDRRGCTKKIKRTRF